MCHHTTRIIRRITHRITRHTHTDPFSVLTGVAGVVGITSNKAMANSKVTTSSRGTASSKIMISIKVMVRPKAHGLESQLPLAKPAVAGEASLRQLLA
jgi:hypothetical protein